MEKLIIKNFGPISDIEIELNKYVVLIGDTSTGKSIIAKLIRIFQECLYVGLENIEDFIKKINEYNIPYLNKNSLIEYYLDEKFIKVEENNIRKSDDFEKISMMLKENVSFILKNNFRQNKKNPEKLIDEIIFPAVTKMKRDIEQAKPLYIPAERMFFSMVGESIAGLWANEINVSKSYLNFARYYEVAKKSIPKLEYPDLNFVYYRNDESEYIKCGEKDVEIKYTSSGIQAILPLVIVLRDLLNKREESTTIKRLGVKTICIEEPEISLFPNRQKGLLEYIVSLIKKIDSRVIITTHSPYILSAFNNLILANNTAIEKNDKEKEIEEIIEKDKWIDFEDVSAYEVKDGKVVSLLDEEYKGINVSAIDEVSDRLSEDVDRLISIRYEG